MATPLPRTAPTLRDIQVAMDEFVEARGWYGDGSAKPQEPRNLAASIALEASEVLECFQWGDPANPDEVAAELADVVLYVAQLANVLGIDLAAAVSEKQRLNEVRFPALAGEPWASLAS
jgi:dCTP diphosphatase